MAMSRLWQHSSVSIIRKSFDLKNIKKSAIKFNVRQRLKSVLLLPILIVFSIKLSGCAAIALPVYYPEDDPFPEEKYSFIVPGSTSKMKVKEELGKPSATRLGEKIYIYAKGRKNWRWVGVWGVLGHGEFFNIPTYLTHLLIINFDKDDVVSTFEEFIGDSGELKSGLFVVNSGVVIDRGHFHFFEEQLILGSSQDMDKQAKQFTVQQNKSAIYFYRKFSDFVRARLDGIVSGDPGSEGFIVWVVDPGEHHIGTLFPDLSNLTISCHPGEKHYIENKKGVLEEKNKAIGETEISKRKLVIDRLDTFDLNSNEYPK